MSVIKINNKQNNKFIGYISTTEFYAKNPNKHSKRLADALRSPHHLLVSLANDLNKQHINFSYIVCQN